MRGGISPFGHSFHFVWTSNEWTQFRSLTDRQTAITPYYVAPLLSSQETHFDDHLAIKVDDDTHATKPRTRLTFFPKIRHSKVGSDSDERIDGKRNQPTHSDHFPECIASECSARCRILGFSLFDDEYHKL